MCIFIWHSISRDSVCSYRCSIGRVELWKLWIVSKWRWGYESLPPMSYKDSRNTRSINHFKLIDWMNLIHWWRQWYARRLISELIPKNPKSSNWEKTDPPKIKNLLTIPFLIFQEGRSDQKGRNFEPGPQVVEKNISNFQHNI